MAKKGMTKRQFWLQSISLIINSLLGVYWIVVGILAQETFQWIAGIAFLVAGASIVSLLYLQYRRNPIVDEELDRKLTRDFKDVWKAMGVVAAVVAVGLILSFLLVWILK